MCNCKLGDSTISFVATHIFHSKLLNCIPDTEYLLQVCVTRRAAAKLNTSSLRASEVVAAKNST